MRGNNSLLHGVASLRRIVAVSGFVFCFLATLTLFAKPAESNSKTKSQHSKDIKITFYIDTHRNMRAHRGIFGYDYEKTALSRSASALWYISQGDSFKELEKTGAIIADTWYCFFYDNKKRMLERHPVNRKESYKLATVLEGNGVLEDFYDNGKNLICTSENFVSGFERRRDWKEKNLIVLVITNNMELQSGKVNTADGMIIYFININDASNSRGFYTIPRIRETIEYQMDKLGFYTNIKDSYELPASEQAEMKSKLDCKSDNFEIVISGFNSLKKLSERFSQKYWNLSVYRGSEKIVEQQMFSNANEIKLQPVKGQNKIKVVFSSPVGVEYNLEWNQGLYYDSFTAEEKSLIGNAVFYAKKKENFLQDKRLHELKEITKDLNLPVLPQYREHCKTIAESMLNDIKIADKRDAGIGDIDKQLTKQLEFIEKKLSGEIKNTIKDKIDSLRKELTSKDIQIEKLKKDVDDIDATIQLSSTRLELLEKVNSKSREYSDAEIKNYSDFKQFAKEISAAKSLEILNEIADRFNHWNPVLRQKLNAIVKNRFDKLRDEHVPWKNDIDNFAELEQIINRVNSMSETELQQLSWTPRYSSYTLKKDVRDKLEFHHQSQDQIENWDQLQNIDKGISSIKNGDIDAIRKYRKELTSWTPAYKVIPEQERKAYIDKCNDYLTKYPDASNQDEVIAYKNELSQLDKSAKERFCELCGLIDALSGPPPQSSFPWTVLFPVFIVVGIIVLLILKKKNRPVATIGFQVWNSSEPEAPIEVPFKKEISLESLGCKFDIRASCIKAENGQISFQLSSPNQSVWIAPSGGNKKELTATVQDYIDGEFLVYETKNSMREFGRVELRTITE